MIYSRTINEHEVGVLYRRGKIVGLLQPGKHWFLWFDGSEVKRFDARPTPFKFSVQEMPTKDRAAVRVSLLVEYTMVDPVKALRAAQNYLEHAYNQMQLALRELVGGKELEELLGDRGEIDKWLMEKLAPEFKAVGLKLGTIAIKDIILPHELKAAYAEQLSSTARGKAQLELARAQTATLRHLANTAEMIEKHPEVLELLALQTASQHGGHTVNLELAHKEK